MAWNYDHEKHKSIVHTMATCHSLRVIDGELLGDPLDVKMFQFTGWSFEESEGSTLERPNVMYDTIKPSIARPPSSTPHMGGYGQNGHDVRDLAYLPIFFLPSSCRNDADSTLICLIGVSGAWNPTVF